MKLIIDIPEEIYNSACAINNIWDMRMAGFVCSAITNGTQLPKGHGDLVDRDGINSRFNAIYDELESLSAQPTYKELLDKLSMCLDTAEPVIKNNYEEMEEQIWK